MMQKFKCVALFCVASIVFAACNKPVVSVPAPTPTIVPTSLPTMIRPIVTPVSTPIPNKLPAIKPKATPIAKLVIKQLPSDYKSDTPRELSTTDTIVIHSHYNPTAKDPFSIASSKAVFDAEQVSAHYVIDRTGTVWQLVPENYMAWHAGVSQMPAPDNRTAVNYFSVGIELTGTKTSGYTASQYQSLVRLCEDIISRLPIKYVVGHRTISPGRKTDPWVFDWASFTAKLHQSTVKSVRVLSD